MSSPDQLKRNLGTRRVPALRSSNFPDAGAAVQTLTSSTRPAGSVDISSSTRPRPTAASGSAASTGSAGAAART